jgi:putative nucleotidyltransferase with HDIG domain
MDRAMLSLQAAASGRKLYGLEHPAARRSIEQAFEALSVVLGAGTQARVVRLNNSLLFKDAELPSRTQLSEVILPCLVGHAIEWIEFDRGLARPELQTLVEQLERPPGEDNPIGTVHVRTGQLGRSRSGGEALSRQVTLLTAADQVDQLKRIWNQLQAGEAPRSHLADLVESIRLTVAVGEDVCQQLADVKSHDEYTFVHTVNVGILSAALGEAIGMTEEQVFQLTVAALLHDVGKQHTPLTILNKTGKLEDGERKKMERHTMDGAAILLKRRGVPDVAPIVAFEHHANLDGTGYPKLVAPPHLASQIVHIADVFDALRTNRPYRAAMDPQKVRSILLEGSGKFFEQDLLNLFLDRVVKLRGASDPS